MKMSKKLYDPLYRCIETGEVVRASEYGLKLHLSGWQEAKQLGCIEPGSTDFERPNELTLDELIQIGTSHLSDMPEDWELIEE